MITVEIDKPVEVTSTEYAYLMNDRAFRGVLAGRRDPQTGQHYIKLWYISRKELLETFLNRNKS